jgi:proteasome lid subunit RPN8/RPN11
MSILLDENVRSAIARQAEKSYPEECCGFLLGRERPARRVLSIRPARNISTEMRRRRFVIDPLEYMSVERELRNQELELVGIYHSHPDHPAVASEHDQASALPWFSYVIASVSADGTGDIRSWRLDEQREFKEERVDVQAAIANRQPDSQ